MTTANAESCLAAAEKASAEAERLEKLGGPRRLQRAAELREAARLWRWQAEQDGTVA